MAKTIITDTAGGILHLPKALARYPESKIVVYHRCSSWGQAGKEKIKLIERSDRVQDEVRAKAPNKLKRVAIYGVEEGKLSVKRPKLIEAAKYASQHKLILVSADLSRFIRAEAYSRRTNREAVPTIEEFALLREMTLNVPLATLLPPNFSESGRHRVATKRSNCAGRPNSIDLRTALRIFALLGMGIMETDKNGNDRIKWEQPVSEVAKKLKVSKSSIFRLLNAKLPPEVPPKYVGGRTDLRWKDLVNPCGMFEKVPREIQLRYVSKP